MPRHQISSINVQESKYLLEPIIFSSGTALGAGAVKNLGLPVFKSRNLQEPEKGQQESQEVNQGG